MARKILVVDDERHIVRLLETILGCEDYEVVVAYDGVEALEMVQAEKPDLIILNDQMPRMTGFEVLQELRADRETGSIPVVMTADDTGTDTFKGWQSGVSAYVIKPINLPDLIAQIKRIIDSLDEGPPELTMVP